MKYNIYINQKALINSKLDLKDAAILDYIKAFCGVDDKRVKQLVVSENGMDYKYTWINFNHLIKEMPILGIKQKASISERIKNIEKRGYIKCFMAPERSLYIRIMPKIKELDFEIGVSQNEQGVSLDEQGVSLDEQQVLANTNSTNITSYNNNISKHISELINYFKDISPTNYKDWFGLPPQRKAAKSLLEFHTLEELKVIIEEFLPKINVMPYVSKDCKAFSPKELKENFDKISAKYKELGLQQKQKSGVKIGVVK
mgnify:CR=1 FL=1